MHEASYQEAVQLLKRRVGSQWMGMEADGRDEMRAILEHELGYSRREADDTIDALVETGELRYVRGDGQNETDAPAPPIEATSGGAANWSVSAGAPLITPIATAAPRAGYWQIGNDDAVTDTSEVRKGQVQPR